MKLAPIAAAAACSFALILAPARGETPGIPTRTELKPIQFQEYDLPNGLHVILHENHSSPVITTSWQAAETAVTGGMGCAMPLSQTSPMSSTGTPMPTA